MSPAQLHRHPSKLGYVGTAVDVWAAGVLLSVMLLGEPRSSDWGGRDDHVNNCCRAASLRACASAMVTLHLHAA